MENPTDEEILRFFKDPDKIEGIHPVDMAKYFRKLYEVDRDIFYHNFKLIPKNLMGETLLELPENISEDIIAYLPKDILLEAARTLESDDATDLIQEIEEVDTSKGHQIISELGPRARSEIKALKSYSDEQAGSIMQTELFKAKENETIKHGINRLTRLKAKKSITSIYQVFVVNEENLLLGSIALEDLITFDDFSITFKSALENKAPKELITISDLDPIENAVKIFEKYNLSYIPVVNQNGILKGRITSDDILDAMELIATEQIYNLAGVDEEEEFGELIFGVFRSRALWLLINLLTAILASYFIGLFDETIQKFIPLAILMPIVASMGGNAGTQTLTVMVRQMAIGEVDSVNATKALKKEVLISILNGLIFAFIMGVIAFLWFNSRSLGLVIAGSMVINLMAAGFFGAIIPLFLKKMKTDPAFGSSIVLTTVTDIVGFISFLGLARLFL